MEEIKYRVNVQSVPCNFPNTQSKTCYRLVHGGIADLNRIVNEIMAVNPGLERETVEAVLKLEQRIIMKLTLNGMRVNNGLFSAVATPKGEGGSMWKTPDNKLNIKITQGTAWRDKIRETNVTVIGNKADVMYIDNVTSNNEENRLIAGRMMTATGNYLKLIGEGDNIGIFFVNSSNEETKVDNTMIAVNEPKTLTFVVPTSLTPGTYILRVATMYSRNSTPEKEPRMTEYTVTIE